MLIALTEVCTWQKYWFCSRPWSWYMLRMLLGVSRFSLCVSLGTFQQRSILYLYIISILHLYKKFLNVDFVPSSLKRLCVADDIGQCSTTIARGYTTYHEQYQVYLLSCLITFQYYYSSIFMILKMINRLKEVVFYEVLRDELVSSVGLSFAFYLSFKTVFHS